MKGDEERWNLFWKTAGTPLEHCWNTFEDEGR
jgi:hypothetical protein